MEKVDLVIVGAEGVVENGGIINKVGTVTIPRSPGSLNKTLVDNQRSPEPKIQEWAGKWLSWQSAFSLVSTEKAR